MNKKQKIILGSVIGIALLGLGGWFIFVRDDKPAQQSAETSNTPIEPDDHSEPQTSYTQEEPTEEEPKNSVNNAPVKGKPTVYTGFGHSQSNPLKNGQSTSTTCTTDARVECILTFTNTQTNEKITFETKKTDGQGVALWDWVGGDDVGSGTWHVVATAGANQSSDKETIYIQ